MSEVFPEAGAVANVDYKRTDGFVVKLTLRDEDGKKVLTRLEGALITIKAQGGVPYEKSFAKVAKPIEYVEGRKCPTCGARLVKSDTKKGKVIKCETNKYDFTTKQSSGCQFVEWPDSN